MLVGIKQKYIQCISLSYFFKLHPTLRPEEFIQFWPVLIIQLLFVQLFPNACQCLPVFFLPIQHQPDLSQTCGLLFFWWLTSRQFKQQRLFSFSFRRFMRTFSVFSQQLTTFRQHSLHGSESLFQRSQLFLLTINPDNIFRQQLFQLGTSRNLLPTGQPFGYATVLFLRQHLQTFHFFFQLNRLPFVRFQRTR